MNTGKFCYRRAGPLRGPRTQTILLQTKTRNLRLGVYLYGADEGLAVFKYSFMRCKTWVMK